MSLIRNARAAFILLTVVPLHLRAQRDSAELARRIDGIFAQFNRSTPGCGVGLAANGRPLYVHGYGSANLEYGVPNTDSTVFESGSVAKQFTASAILLLVADGKLRLDDDIRKFIPEVPRFGGQTITIRNLLTHTSGLRDQWGLLGIEGRGAGQQVHTPMTTLDLVSHQKMLNFPPGSEYLYSNTGYALAGIIVERVSGMTLGEFSRTRLFEPLGMAHTQLRDDFTRIVPNRATAYAGSAASGYHLDMPFTNMVGNGGVLSTMADLIRWNENLDHPVVGGPAYAAAMQTPMRLTNGRTINYALGLIVSSYHGAREVSHSGSTAGYSTFLARYPDQRLSVAVWCNQAGINATELAHAVVAPMLPQTTAAAVPHPERVELAPASLARWTATYRDPHTDQVLGVVASGQTLSLQPVGRGRAVALESVEPARFHSAQGDLMFDGPPGHRRFTLVRADADSSQFEEVRSAPAVIPQADYVGVYASDELDARYTIVAKGSGLVLTRRPYQEFELRPVYADDFQSSGGLGSLRFVRDARGKVTGFSFYAGRVLDVRFNRLSP
jgi:CubicO group peptidase (beta-lactamase class C family)